MTLYAPPTKDFTTVCRDFRTQWKAFQEAEPFLDVLRGFINAIDWRVSKVAMVCNPTKKDCEYIDLSLLSSPVITCNPQEPWIVAIMAFHAIMFVTAVLMRKRTNVQLLLACIAG